jgi:hypothetical protein
VPAAIRHTHTHYTHTHPVIANKHAAAAADHDTEAARAAAGDEGREVACRAGGSRRQTAHDHGDTFLAAVGPRAIVHRESSKPLQGDRRLEVCVADLPPVKMQARCDTI